MLCLFLRQKHNSLNEIGRYVKRNHSTVVHSIRRAKELLEIKDEIATIDVSEPKQAPEALQTSTGCELAYNYNWDIEIAHAICMAESGGNPNAFNQSNYDGSNDKGLFQINSCHVISGLISDNERFDPKLNVEAAYKIYQGSGFTAWSAYNNQSYRRFL